MESLRRETARHSAWRHHISTLRPRETEERLTCLYYISTALIENEVSSCCFGPVPEAMMQIVQRSLEAVIRLHGIVVVRYNEMIINGFVQLPRVDREHP